MPDGGSTTFTVPLDDGLDLAGTLRTPSRNPPHPAVLIVNGSGPVDRDSDMPGQRIGLASALADALAGRGVASARFDKRGVGASGGEHLGTGFEQEIADAARVLAWLRAHPDVDRARIGVVGHSVGATIAARLAATARVHDVAAVVLLAAAARTGDEVVRHQTQRIADSMTGLARLQRRGFLRSQERTLAALPGTAGDVAVVGRETVPARWLREYLHHDPTEDLRRITVPVLAVTGRKDLQVDADDVARIATLVRGDFTGSTPPDLTHLIRHTAGGGGIGTYPKQLAEPPAADVVAQVADWTAAHLGSAP